MPRFLLIFFENQKQNNFIYGKNFKEECQILPEIHKIKLGNHKAQNDRRESHWGSTGSDSAGPGPAGSGPAGSGPAGSDPAGSGPVNSDLIRSGRAGSGQVGPLPDLPPQVKREIFQPFVGEKIILRCPA